MSGGGRGRGRGQFTFNIEAIGFSRGEVLPETRCQPLPLFPPTEFKPVPLNTGEDVNYLLALKQELRGASKKLPYYIESAIAKKDQILGTSLTALWMYLHYVDCNSLKKAEIRDEQKIFGPGLDIHTTNE